VQDSITLLSRGEGTCSRVPADDPMGESGFLS
jgi:hypothetical protein